MRKREDLTGQRFGHLVVLQFDHSNEQGFGWWVCQCDCGNTKVVGSHHLKSGMVKSCGCLLRNQLKTHGGSGSRLYRIWCGMKARCYNPKNPRYAVYGARGIAVCSIWKDSFPAFQEWALANGYQDNLSIDRIDNDQNYCPENCRWATASQQANNKQYNHKVTYKGRTQTLGEWANELGMDYHLLLDRVNRYNMTVEEAFMRPVRHSEVLIEYKGKIQNRAQWARELGIKEEVLASRLKSGWGVERAFTTPVNLNISNSLHGASISYKGDFLPLKELCKKYNISYGTVDSRLQRGMTLEEALETPISNGNHLKVRKYVPIERDGIKIGSSPKDPIELTWRGETKTLYQWAEYLGFSYQTLFSRYKSGWPVEKILTKKSPYARKVAD